MPRPKARARKARTDLYRRLVCEAAERIFAAHGFGGTRVEEIAREAGVSVGTIYRVFPGKKREIYRAIQERRGTEIIGKTRAIGLETWRQRGDLLDAILAGLATMAEYFMRNPEYLQLVLREEQAWGIGPKRPTREQAAMWREGIDDAVMAMRQGIADGLLVDDDPEAMARASVAMQQAHLGYWLERERRDPVDEVVGRLQRQFLRCFCRPEVLATRMATLPRPPSTVQAPASSSSRRQRDVER